MTRVPGLSRNHALVLLVCVAARLQVLLGFVRWRGGTRDLLQDFRSWVWLLLLRDHLLLVLVGNAHFLARVYEVLEVRGVVWVHVVELRLALVDGALVLVYCQAVDVALKVLVHRAMPPRLSRNPPIVDSTRVCYWGIWYSRGATEAWFNALLNCWVNLAWALLHSPRFLGTLQKLRLEVGLTPISNARTRRQVCVPTSILIYLYGVSKVVLLVDYDLVVEVSRRRIGWLGSWSVVQLLAW